MNTQKRKLIAAASLCAAIAIPTLASAATIAKAPGRPRCKGDGSGRQPGHLRGVLRHGAEHHLAGERQLRRQPIDELVHGQHLGGRV